MSGDITPGQVLYYRMSEADRTTYGGAEWGELDIDRLMDSRAGWLERIEREAGSFPVERMLAELNTPFPSARAVRMALWLARKQSGDATIPTDDGRPETWDSFQPQTLRAELQSTPPAAASEPDSDEATPEVTPDPLASDESPATS